MHMMGFNKLKQNPNPNPNPKTLFLPESKASTFASFLQVGHKRIRKRRRNVAAVLHSGFLHSSSDSLCATDQKLESVCGSLIFLGPFFVVLDFFVLQYFSFFFLFFFLVIITAHEVLLLNSRDPSVTPFVQELQARILRHHQAFSSKHHDHHTDSDPDHDHVPDAIKILPFEFVALEACLEAACSVLENEIRASLFSSFHFLPTISLCLYPKSLSDDSQAKTLEQEAHPALDKLTFKISTLNLERVRQIKNRLVAITARVQKVRDELEHLLDDDDDMAEMYLTDKLAEQQMEESSSASSINDHDEQDIDDRHPPFFFFSFTSF
ncbi:Magnesium transporter MRS2-3 Magnesium Transporter [Vigna angularis]|uniref:Magnesium transporter MRS2-3 Magnesium Transporter n=1 Tax=Phaseolus angularis TaxID=3914 RepID=A0A8T0LET1_PHAAN|nr:Magnesium transporter MRS2-3 Magnesium Transporter [Vigna angularis]